MAIYTRTGDDGTTALYGGKRLPKSDPHIEAYGSVDELTSVLGVLMFYTEDKQEKAFIEDIQRDLYVIMGFLAHAPSDLSQQKKKIALFEKKIDALSKTLDPLKTFILPNGSIASCWAHVARTICRRSERAIVLSLKQRSEADKQNSNTVVVYINRLSDLLFTYARAFNKAKEVTIKK